MSESKTSDLKYAGDAELPPNPLIRVWRVRRVYQFADGRLVGIVGLAIGEFSDCAEEAAADIAKSLCWLEREEFDASRLISSPFRCEAATMRRIRKEWAEYERLYGSPN